LRRRNLRADSNIAFAVVDSRVLRGYPIGRESRILEKCDIYDGVVCYLQTLPMKMPGPRRVEITEWRKSSIPVREKRNPPRSSFTG
jgi:hypothetical protein